MDPMPQVQHGQPPCFPGGEKKKNAKKATKATLGRMAFIDHQNLGAIIDDIQLKYDDLFGIGRSGMHNDAHLLLSLEKKLGDGPLLRAVRICSRLW